MGTKIEWADDTVNPWWGCVKQSPACDACYAERISDRFGAGQYLWGPHSRRLVKDGLAIESLRKIARKSDRQGRPRRVFIESMGDFFEDNLQLVEPRKRFWDAILALGPRITPMFLTKRASRMLEWSREMGWPEWAWALVTVEDQEAADRRIPHLLEMDAPIRGISIEPMLGPVRLDHMDAEAAGHRSWCFLNVLTGRHTDMGRPCPDVPHLDWVICGGETGPGARPMYPGWPMKLRDQCFKAGVPFFFKGWGEYGPGQRFSPGGSYFSDAYFVRFDGELAKAGDGFDPINAGHASWMQVRKRGKKYNGRQLDGREWDEFPEV